MSSYPKRRKAVSSGVVAALFAVSAGFILWMSGVSASASTTTADTAVVRVDEVSPFVMTPFEREMDEADEAARYERKAAEAEAIKAAADLDRARQNAADVRPPDSNRVDETVASPIRGGDQSELTPAVRAPTTTVAKQTARQAPPNEPVKRHNASSRRLRFAHLMLDEMGIARHDNAVLFLVSWQRTEACKNNNPFCLLNEDRDPYKYGSERHGAQVMARQLDARLGKPRGYIQSYPAIVSALDRADTFDSPEAIVNHPPVFAELRKWCGKPTVCGGEEKLSYQQKLEWNLARIQIPS